MRDDVGRALETDSRALSMELIRHAAEVAWSFRMFLLPRRGLEQTARQIILSRFLTGCDEAVFFKSGRSALRAVFRSLAGLTPHMAVLMPDYICNVVPRAARLEGFECIGYRTDDCCAVDKDDLRHRLQSQPVAAVVLASLFGASNTTPALVEAIRSVSPQTVIVLDECQNLVPDNNVRPDPRTLIVFSFNRKTIPGAMGGGVAFCRNFLNLHSPKAQARDMVLEFYVWLVVMNQVREHTRAMLRRLHGRPPYPPPHIEYTPERGRMHYDLEIQRIARLSLCRAVDGMLRFSQLQRARQSNFIRLQQYLVRSGAGSLLRVESPQNCPFVPIKLKELRLVGEISLKGPYGLEGNPYETLRPSLLCYRNEPIWERESA